MLFELILPGKQGSLILMQMVFLLHYFKIKDEKYKILKICIKTT